jgi:hypothetical protein
MDNKQIKDFVESVAEIKELKPVTDGSRPPDDATEVFYNGEWIEVSQKTNPTLGFKFIKLKEVERECMLGCGERVINQKVEKRFVFTPVRHWRTRCATCQSFVHPNGEELIKGGHAVQAAFLRHFNKEE